MISEAAEKAALDVICFSGGMPWQEYAEKRIQSAIDAETDAALERAAKECDELGQQAYDKYEENKEDYPSYASLKYAESSVLATASTRIRSLKRGTAK